MDEREEDINTMVNSYTMGFIAGFMEKNLIQTYRFQIHVTQDGKFPSLSGILFLVWETDYHDRVEGYDLKEVLQEFLRRVKWKRSQNAARTPDI